MNRLIASMVVKNELNRYLPLAVGRLLRFCDEIRVLDDGSTDGSLEWLQEQEGVEVLSNPGPHFFEHEGKARQNLLEWTWRGQPDYVLAIDADEFVSDGMKIREAITSNQPVYLLKLVEAWKIDKGGIAIRVDGLWGPRKVPILYQRPEGRAARTSRTWRIADRQLACGREPVEVVKRAGRAPLLDVEVFHFGWARRAEREARAQRYFDHDGGRFHQNRHLQSILWPDEKVGLSGRPWPPSLRDIADPLLAYVAD